MSIANDKAIVLVIKKLMHILWWFVYLQSTAQWLQSCNITGRQWFTLP